MSSAALKRVEVAKALADKVRAALIHQRSTRAFKEAVQERIISLGRADTELLEPQKRVLDDNSRLLALCCSRRAGKTELLSRLIAATLEECGHEEYVAFGAKTLGIAKKLIWADLEIINEKYCLGWKINHSDLTITTSRGGRFVLFGVDDRKAVEKVRGFRYRLVICDEASTYPELLEPLLEQAFMPGTMDLRGRVVLSGTPGYVKDGYWFEAVHGVKPGWSVHHWTIFDNHYIPDVVAELAALRARHGWDEEHPTYRCEYLGQWVDYSSRMVVDFLESRNVVDKLPDGYSKTGWPHVIGIDFGSVDACAWEVIAVDPHSDDRYVVHDFAESGLVGDEPVEITRQLVEEFDTTDVVCDPGGGGKFFFETFNAKHGSAMKCAIRAADKQDLLGSIRLLNTELRMGRLKFLRRETLGVVADSKKLIWKDDRREKIVEGASFKQDRFDALRYGVLRTVAWKASPKPAPVDAAQAAADRARLERARRAEKRLTASWFDRR